MTPVICMVTAGEPAATIAGTIERIALAARSGVTLVQVRERHLEGAALLDLVGRAVQAVRSTRARVVVNDRLDVALGAGAHGVHLRADSMPALRVRAIAPRGFLVGRSVHGETEAASARGVDYLIFGTVFPTSSKSRHEPAGVGALAQVAASTTLPVLAIGGIDAVTASQAAVAGAAGFAAISMFSGVSLDRLPDAVRAARTAFEAAEYPR